MSNTNTGGPAFPFVCDADFDYGTGMTLRDYFAAKALVAIITDLDTEEAEKIMGKPFRIVAAHLAYGFADAMLKVREE